MSIKKRPRLSKKKVWLCHARTIIDFDPISLWQFVDIMLLMSLSLNLIFNQAENNIQHFAPLHFCSRQYYIWINLIHSCSLPHVNTHTQFRPILEGSHAGSRVWWPGEEVRGQTGRWKKGSLSETRHSDSDCISWRLCTNTTTTITTQKKKLTHTDRWTTEEEGNKKPHVPNHYIWLG